MQSTAWPPKRCRPKEQAAHGDHHQPHGAAARCKFTLGHHGVHAAPPALQGPIPCADQAHACQDSTGKSQPAQPRLFDQTNQCRCQRHSEHGQHRHQVDLALAARHTEEHKHQRAPQQQQEQAGITLLQPGAPIARGAQVRQRHRKEMKQQYRNKIPEWLGMPTHRTAIAFGGLVEQDVVHIGQVLWRATQQRHADHGHQPQQDGTEKSQRPKRPAPTVALCHQDTRPAPRACQQVRQDHHQRQHAYAFGDHAQPGCETPQPVSTPVRATQKMQQQAPVAHGDEQHDEWINLRALDLVDKLERCE